MTNLHRAKKVPEWELVSEDNWNIHQRVAAKTGGIVTLANLVSVAGAGFVIKGLYDFTHGHRVRGLVEIGVGRGLDVVDGIVSDRCQTKGPVGEAIDAGIDKVLMSIALITLTKAGIVPKKDTAYIGIQNGLNVAATAVAKQNGNEIHPDEFGKNATFGQWAGILGHAVAEVVPTGGEVVHELASDIANGATIGLGGVASLHLFQSAFGKTDESDNSQYS